MLEWALPHVFGPGEYHEKANLIQVGDHVVQLFAHASGDAFEHWFVFDDLWGNDQRDLADALLCYATRWDVLSTGDETRHE